MIIKKFRARNFRNIGECEIEFSSGVNILLGDNAEGKTNVLEGIYLFSRGKSHRAREERELVKFGEDGFFVSIDYESEGRESSLEYSLYGRERRRKKNGYKLKGARELMGSFKSVLFYPDDLQLVKAGPEERRAFLNVAISQIYPSYVNFYSNYKYALENRNNLLKKAKDGLFGDREEIVSWSLSMAKYATDIYIFRRDYIKKLELYAKGFMKDISEGGEELSFGYKSNIPFEIEKKEKIEEYYALKLTENLEREISAGTTLYGVHRDDLEIFINGKESRLFASQGQQRSTVLSIKLAEGEVSREISGEYPVFLFDDVLSELDEKRRKYLVEGIGKRQIIITSCERELVDGIGGKIISVKNGEYAYVSSHR